jgi:hypothetical protein
MHASSRRAQTSSRAGSRVSDDVRKSPAGELRTSRTSNVRRRVTLSYDRGVLDTAARLDRGAQMRVCADAHPCSVTSPGQLLLVHKLVALDGRGDMGAAAGLCNRLHA